jgi:hypothetical protein
VYWKQFEPSGADRRMLCDELCLMTIQLEVYIGLGKQLACPDARLGRTCGSERTIASRCSQ